MGLNDIKLDLKNMALVLGIIISLSSMIYGTFKYLNATYALADDFKEHKINTKYEFLHIKLEKINNRIWELEAKIERGIRNYDNKKELESLKIDKEITIKTIQDIESSKLK